MTRDEHKTIIDRIRNTAGEQAGALISDDLAMLVNDYSGFITNNEEMKDKITNLQKDNQDLIIANGKLFQKVGYEKIDDTSDNEKEKDSEEEHISIEDIINEKGGLI